MPLLLGSFVRVEIEAGILENVLVIPQGTLREGQKIWVVDQKNELQIRDVEILWVRQDSVLIGNVMRPGEQLIASDLKAPLPGLKVNPQPLGGGVSPADFQTAVTQETETLQ